MSNFSFNWYFFLGFPLVQSQIETRLKQENSMLRNFTLLPSSGRLLNASFQFQPLWEHWIQKIIIVCLLCTRGLKDLHCLILGWPFCLSLKDQQGILSKWNHNYVWKILFFSFSHFSLIQCISWACKPGAWELMLCAPAIFLDTHLILFYYLGFRRMWEACCVLLQT